MVSSRRKFLNLSAGLLGASILPKSIGAAVAEERGIVAPRVALVIGNGSYRNSPLDNPVNDASAISKTLADLGFQCQLLTNANLQGMVAAVKSHGEKLARLKAVGLFYYAGHGAQLGWRNYLVPVDASIASLEEMPRQTFELNTLLLTLKEAANPMNVIILDACRDNPFGTRVPLEQKGLSQFDAPAGSLLSYATAPGNTASDGDGANGLFTESLLREMRIAGAKLEDVFKRVRLQVRLKSKGQQIPWESTSLEEDFYFTRTPGQQAKVSEEQKAALFAEETAVWNATQDASDAEQLSAYLTRYPDGKFSQLAQVQLDRLLNRSGENKIELASSVNNPFTKGTAKAIGQYAVGDTYDFELRDSISGARQRTYREAVSEVSETQIIFNNGALVLDAIGNEIKSENPRFLSPAQLFPAEYTVGAKWSTRFGWRRGNGDASAMALDLKVSSRALFRTPAGEFNAFKVTGSGWVQGGSYWTVNYWIDPDKCLRPLQFEMFTRGIGKRGGIVSDQVVLLKYSQKSAGG
jgi:uncharacterized caspase-like protein